MRRRIIFLFLFFFLFVVTSGERLYTFAQVQRAPTTPADRPMLDPCIDG